MSQQRVQPGGEQLISHKAQMMVLALLVLLFLGFASHVAAAEDSKPASRSFSLSAEESHWIAEHPVVRLGIDPNYGPYSFLDHNGQLDGVVREFLAYFEQTLGLHFEIVSNLDWPQLMAAVQNRELDAVATVVHLQERDAFLAFTEIYLPTPLVVITRDDTPQLRSLTELQKLRLTLVEGYSSSKQVMAQYPALRPAYVATPLHGLRAVASGMTDAYVGALGVNTFLASQHGISNLKVNATFDMAENGQRFGVRKDWPQLASLLDKALNTMPARQWAEIMQRWLPIQAREILRLSQPSFATLVFPWLLGTLTIVVLGYLVTLLWNRQLKRELARRRAELERAQSVAHLGDWSMDVVSGRIHWSNELFRIAGRPPADLDWPTLRGWIHPDERDAHEHFLSRLGTAVPGEHFPPLISHLLRPDGSSRWLEISCATDFDRQNKPCRHYGTALDITERKQQEDETKRLHAILHALVEGSTDAIFVKDLAGRYLLGNGGLATLLGRPIEDILGASDDALFPPEYAERFRADDQRIIAAGRPETFEETVVSDGKTLPYLTTKGPLLIDGKVEGVFGIACDISQLKQSEIAVRKSEERYRTLFEYAPDGIVIADPESNYLDANAEICRVLGYTRTELIGLHASDIVVAAEHTNITPALDIIKRKSDYQREWQFRRKDGSTFVAEVMATMMPDGNLLGVVRDITARKLAEAALVESKTRLRLFIDHAPAALAMLDHEMRYLAISRRWLSDYGLENAEILGRSHYEIFPEVPDSWKEIHRRAMAGDVLRADEDRFERADGSVQWLCWEVRPWYTASGNVGGIVIFSEDITERKMATQALREQEEFFRLIAENMGDMVTVLDTKGQRLYSSPAYRELYGDTDAMQGVDTFANIHPDDSERVRQAFRQTLETGVGQRGNFRVVLADGSIREIESQSGVVKDAEQRVTRVVVVSRDVTERKQLEDEIRQLNTELEERVRQRTDELAMANKELETFTYSVSHDLKAPLRGIDGYSRLLLEEHQSRLDDEGRLFLNNVRQGVEQMGQLIEDLLAYSRMERRRMNDQTLDLARMVSGALAERHADIEARGMIVEAAGLQGLSVHADPDGLSMVLRNLVDNALKFTGNSLSPTLAIRATATEKSVILEIQDNGIGFDMKFHDRIFDIFQRLQRAEDFPGTGVGLAIVNKAMQRMGGRVWAQSAPGQGATFYLELPR